MSKPVASLRLRARPRFLITFSLLFILELISGSPLPSTTPSLLPDHLSRLISPYPPFHYCTTPPNFDSNSRSSCGFLVDSSVDMATTSRDPLSDPLPGQNDDPDQTMKALNTSIPPRLVGIASNLRNAILTSARPQLTAKPPILCLRRTGRQAAAIRNVSRPNVLANSRSSPPELAV